MSSEETWLTIVIQLKTSQCNDFKQKGNYFFFVNVRHFSITSPVCGMYLEFTWHYELWSFHTDKGVHAAEEQNGQDDRKVADELPHLEGGKHLQQV